MAQRIFDPVGVSSPIFLNPSYYYRSFGRIRLENWNTEVPENIKNDFIEW